MLQPAVVFIWLSKSPRAGNFCKYYVGISRDPDMKSGNAHVKADFNLLQLLSDSIIVTVCYAQLPSYGLSPHYQHSFDEDCRA